MAIGIDVIATATTTDFTEIVCNCLTPAESKWPLALNSSIAELISDHPDRPVLVNTPEIARCCGGGMDVVLLSAKIITDFHPIYTVFSPCNFL